MVDEKGDSRDSVRVKVRIAVVVVFALVLAAVAIACNGCSSLKECPSSKEKEKSVAVLIM